MTLQETIYKRKSIRKYDEKPLDENQLSEIEDYCKGLTPLYKENKITFEIVSNTKNVFGIKAPHYIIVSGDKNLNDEINAGFMFQQLDLYLQSMGIGSCWYGLGKSEKKGDLDLIIIIAFGNANEPMYREVNEFKRRSLAEIANVVDEKLSGARLAPSAVNKQPWYFVKNEDSYDVYSKKYGAIQSIVFKRYSKHDIGIALSHIYIENMDTFEFFTTSNYKEVEGYNYICSFKI